MSTWPNRGPPAAPAGGWKKENRTAKTVRPHPSDSSQHASSIAGVVQTEIRIRLGNEEHKTLTTPEVPVKG